MQASAVLLPQPDGPSSVRNSPSAILRSSASTGGPARRFLVSPCERDACHRWLALAFQRAGEHAPHQIALEAEARSRRAAAPPARSPRTSGRSRRSGAGTRKPAMITGMVCAFGVPVRISAKMNSFQLTRKQKIPVATMPGRATGSTIFQDRPEARAAVDQRGLFEVGRHALEIALHHPGARAAGSGCNRR